MTEPCYFSEGAAAATNSEGEGRAVGTLGKLVNRVTPRKKAAMLKVLSTPRRKLVDQGAGLQMLPPGCSIKEPSYSIKDPVYFQD
ncbi:hypothetical protein MNEG_0745 [Monoraphidium neglectum]|uniref:Uncharacterized protein n=1 Tax=Monoraphidium neglectum TaxID=145388 RepID=A0A0D2KAC1_9CHLO|nr:hypothetical protein MNEG_0745 [Monoraphidium neglectum]KIZ07213.1 hypothetical protein MNEG_0745 [Monoraphidium neglectum]|eukprot:XP_013906232.1 hypothetical protein MNEG_0745 [Monoraphidium neglectum]